MGSPSYSTRALKKKRYYRSPARNGSIKNINVVFRAILSFYQHAYMWVFSITVSKVDKFNHSKIREN
jgi:hypothetical protein